ncbi:glycosyltransferase family 2 protein, partial [Pseudotabrizicola sediminis]|uniref:glycosyltransferase family 2 protein n=1 Tax=Pseudotabrizicola sediminis TaxID=2486418 RepID=UPI001FD991AA
MDSAHAALANAKCAGIVIIVDDGDDFPVRQTLANRSTSALRIAVNPGPKGPSAARNHGAGQAQSELLFFLDDDDLMEEDYIKRILAQRRSGSCKTAWGFSKIRDSRAYHGLPTNATMLGPEVPLRQRLVGIGTGFWVERVVFQKLGGLDENLRINEDTDFCLALASDGLMPWYDPEPGVKLDAARPIGTGGTDRPSITKSALAAERAAAWQYILKK